MNHTPTTAPSAYAGPTNLTGPHHSQRRQFLTTLAALALPMLVYSNIQAAPTTTDLDRHFGAYKGAFVLLDAATGRPLVRYHPERCATRLPPCSTFKIPNSLIGLETGELSGPNHPEKWDGVKYSIAEWNHDQTLRTAFDVSAVWYFQRLARRIGPERMKSWITRIGYGNQDTSGPIDQFWLGKPLLISADEQAAFLLRLYRGDLPFSQRTLAIVRDDLLIRDRHNGAILRGKTGTPGSREKHRVDMGWFVGWVTSKEGKSYIFATNITGGEKPLGFTARKITEGILRDKGWW